MCVCSIQDKEEGVQSYRARMLDQVEETYLVDGKACRENENMVTKLVIEKDDIPLLTK